MAKVKGEAVYVSVYITDQYVKVGGQKDAGLNITQDPMDTTDKDSAGWKEKELGNREVTVDFSSFLIEDNAGWLELKKGLINLAGDHQKCNCRVHTVGYTYTGTWIMSSLSISGPKDDMAEVSFSLVSDKIITEAAA